MPALEIHFGSMFAVHHLVNRKAPIFFYDFPYFTWWTFFFESLIILTRPVIAN